jgi:hypothetical protein
VEVLNHGFYDWAICRVVVRRVETEEERLLPRALRPVFKKVELNGVWYLHVEVYVYRTPECRGGQCYGAPFATNMAKREGGEEPSQRRELGVGREEMSENLRCDFVGKGQDWIFACVEVILHGFPLALQITKRELQNGYLGV